MEARAPTIGVAALVLLSACGEAPARSGPALEATPPYPSEAAAHVDPMIGTGGEGNTFPGAVAPWGMVSVSPHNAYVSPQAFLLDKEPLAPSGYSSGRAEIYGFGLTQLSGVGCPDLGLPVVKAAVGPPRPRFGHDGKPRDGARYRGELAWPGYYAVELEGGITVEATAGERIGVLRLWYPSRPAGDASVLVYAGRGLSWNAPLGRVRVVSEREVEGSSEAGLFCARSNRQVIHFVLRVLGGASATATGTWQGEAVSDAREAAGEAGAYLRFRTEEGRPIEVAVGVSYVSVEGARANLELELGARDFEAVRASTFAAWERTLSRVRVQGGSAGARRVFYTALYHALLHPGRLDDADGRFPIMGRGGVGRGEGARYSVFSLWDSYRTVHPLLSLVYPERQRELLRSIAGMARESGALPQWELAGFEVNMMVGDPAISVIADSYRKGLVDLDLAPLYQTMRAGALESGETSNRRPGNASYRELGYIPIEEAGSVWGPVSTTLEYAYADWALGELAAALGRTEDAARFRAAAGAYRHLLDPSTGLLRPRRRDGSWLEPFDPDALEGSRGHSRSGGPGFVEGTAWHYAFAVPHDIPGLIAAHGGPAAFGARLRTFFESGRFALWNEPDLAFPYLFTYLPGEAWRAQREVRAAIDRHFGPGPRGLPGNDDAGTLSAWLAFSALGFYPDCPGTTIYRLGSPLFDRIELALERGTRFVIEAPGAELQYLAGATLDGAPHPTPTLEHSAIGEGGTLRLVRSAHPTSLW